MRQTLFLLAVAAGTCVLGCSGYAETAAELEAQGGAAPVKRAPVPSLSDQRYAEKGIRDLYKDDFAKTSAQDKLELSRKLSNQADETKDDAVGRYELRVLAIGFAAQSADLKLVLAQHDKLDAEYDGDFKELKRASFNALGTSKNYWINKFAADCKTLLDKPSDPAANLSAGKYLCFSQGDFERGLPLLAKSGQPVLSALASQELPPPDDAVKQNAVAESWWDYGEKSKDKDEKARVIQHALEWYKKALPSFSGLNRAKIENRLARFDVAAAAANAPAKKPEPAVKAPVAATQNGKTDLLKILLRGGEKDWHLNHGALECVSMEKYRMIRGTYTPLAEYDLRATFTRTTGTGDIGFFVVASEQKALLSLCGWSNTLAGFHGVDGHDVDSDQNPTKTLNSIENNKEYKLCVEVRKSSIRAVLNDKELFTYKYEQPNFTSRDGTPAPADGASMGVYCSECTAKISLLEVKDVVK